MRCSPFMRACHGVFSAVSLRTASQEQRTARNFPEEAVLHCRSGLTALKGNLPDQARGSLLRALSLNPMIWEAFEGLCSLGEKRLSDLAPDLVNVQFGFCRIPTRDRRSIPFTPSAN